MKNYIPRYKETTNKVIKMCLQCKHVEELPEATIDCPTCQSVGYMGFWKDEKAFQNYLRMYQPKDLKVHGEKVQNLVNEVLGVR